jgi:hypothetical protein
MSGSRVDERCCWRVKKHLSMSGARHIIGRSLMRGQTEGAG